MNFLIKFLIHLFILLLSSAWILFLCPGFFEINKIPQKLTTSKQCPQSLKGIESPEDMTAYGNVLIVSSRNLLGLQYNKNQVIENGGIYAYYPKIVSEKIKRLEKVPIYNFPTIKKFYPYGMKLFNNETLYVINQSFDDKDGELIEVFQIKENSQNRIELKYIKTIKLPNYLVGKTNNLAVLSENEIFVSQSSVFTFTPLKLMIQLFNIKVCGIYYCKIDSNSNSECFKQTDINSITAYNNGLYLQQLSNGQNRLFVSQSLEKQIAVFSINNRQDPFNKITFQRQIDIDGIPDNIVYDQNYESFFVGSMGKAMDIFKIINGLNQNFELKDEVEAWGSVQIIKNSFYVNNLQAETIVQLNDLIRTISTAVRIDDKLYLGSAFDNRILICDINELFDEE